LSFAFGKRLQLLLPYLLSAAAGALLGTALYSLLTEALERSSSSRRVGLILIAGFLVSFLLERLLGFSFVEKEAQTASHIGVAVSHATSFHHRHEHQKAVGKPLVLNVLLSGAIHSLVDGVGIAVAFSSSHSAGVATALAVLLHEVPHHIADVGVLIYSGISRPRAIALNLLATTGCATGGVLVLIFGSWASALADILLPFTAANFLYIAVGILMPELQREPSRRRSLLQVMTLLVAVITVSSISHYFPEEAGASTLAHMLK
jgi:zinc and cadmium transporter